MPVTVQGPDGKTYQFPDGTDKTAAIRYFKKKGIGAKKPPEPGFLEAHPGENAAAAFARGGAAGVVTPVEHPLLTVSGMGQPFVAANASVGGGYAGSVPILFGKHAQEINQSNLLAQQQAQEGQTEMAEQAVKNPFYTLGSLLVPGLVTHGVLKAGEVLPEKIGRTITGTSPRVMKGLVEETQEANKAEIAKAEEKNTANLEKHKEATKAAIEDAEEKNRIQNQKRQRQLEAHAKKVSDVREENASARELQARKEGLKRGVERLNEGILTDLETTEKNVNMEANRRYTELRAELKDEKADAYQPLDEEGHVEGEPIPLPEHLYEIAKKPLRGTDTESAIIKSLGKRVSNGEVELTYNDLQGYREEIGRELRKGTLPPDTFTAYKNLMNAIDDSMDRIAARKGLGAKQSAARAYYRQYAETFLDRNSPVRKALDSTERRQATRPFRGKDESGIEAVARYDPNLARRINVVRKYSEESAGIRSGVKNKPEPTLSPKSEPFKPKLPPEPKPVEAKTTKIGEEEIKGAKTKALHARVGRLKARGEWIATGAMGYRMLSDILTGNLASVPKEVFKGGLALGGVTVFARVLENPKFMRLLTEPTPRDVAQIPPELRGDLRNVIREAEKQGVPVSPTLIQAVGGISAIMGPQALQLQKTRDQYAGAAQ